MITRITFEIVVDGRKCVATFIRSEKIEELLATPETLGEFLRALADNCGELGKPPAV